MIDSAQGLQMAAMQAAPLLDETPPRRPAPMPMQIVAYWTPRAISKAMLRRVTEVIELQHVRRAVIPVTHADEQG